MKNPSITVVILLACIIMTAGCARMQAQQGAYNKISAEQAKKMMAESKDFILLDVRSEQEYKEQRISGAILIPDNEIKARAEKELPDKNALILVYCRSGRRSAGAAKALVSLGYVNVYDFGGISGWPYETVKN